MKHARSDYNRIQDPSGKIPEDEPVFLIRGQDMSGPDTLRFWAELNSNNGGSKDMSNRALIWATKMDRWQKEHAAKSSDCPPGVLEDQK